MLGGSKGARKKESRSADAYYSRSAERDFGPHYISVYSAATQGAAELIT